MIRIYQTMISMHSFLGQFCLKYNIPQFGRNSATQLISSKIVLIMVPLESMEVGSFAFGCVDMVKGVVSEIIAKVTDHKTKPERPIQMRIIEI